MVAFVSSFFNRAIVSIILIFIAPMPYATANYSKWSVFLKSFRRKNDSKTYLKSGFFRKKTLQIKMILGQKFGL
jgi:hypothetical protein